MKTADIEVFLQGEGIAAITIVRVPTTGIVRDILANTAPYQSGLSGDQAHLVFLEDGDEPLDLEASLQDAGVRNRSRVHVHRCRRISVTVNFNNRHKTDEFPPSATVRRVKRWAVKKDGWEDGFEMSDVDAVEHVLQLCNSTTRPDEDTHIGALTHHPDCTLCFDLVPKQRVEG